MWWQCNIHEKVATSWDWPYNKMNTVWGVGGNRKCYCCPRRKTSRTSFGLHPQATVTPHIFSHCPLSHTVFIYRWAFSLMYPSNITMNCWQCYGHNIKVWSSYYEQLALCLRVTKCLLKGIFHLQHEVLNWDSSFVSLAYQKKVKKKHFRSFTVHPYRIIFQFLNKMFSHSQGFFP